MNNGRNELDRAPSTKIRTGSLLSLQKEICVFGGLLLNKLLLHLDIFD
jgi:hypothetical protein